MEDYEKCKHVQAIGTYAVYVDAGCPKAHKIKGTLVSSRRKCEHCRGGEENEKNTGRNGKLDSGNVAERGEIQSNHGQNRSDRSYSRKSSKG